MQNSIHSEDFTLMLIWYQLNVVGVIDSVVAIDIIDYFTGSG
tara:strand:+ start:231 stop:356 length:126 start_codon:yes stop_codon:yes gene_type:complete